MPQLQLTKLSLKQKFYKQTLAKSGNLFWIDKASGRFRIKCKDPNPWDGKPRRLIPLADRGGIRSERLILRRVTFNLLPLDPELPTIPVKLERDTDAGPLFDSRLFVIRSWCKASEFVSVESDNQLIYSLLLDSSNPSGELLMSVWNYLQQI
ncbi:MAG TPA: hypothetical protein V6D29_11185 [Leptolyngbyaceae cyanobacterium]